MKIKLNNEEIEWSHNDYMMDFLKKKGHNIPGFCKAEEQEPFGACRLCLIDVNGKMTTSCSYKPMKDDVVKTNNKPVYDIRKMSLELMLSDHTGDCIGPCQKGCPADGDVQGYIALGEMGKYHESVRLMKEKYILPAVLGRICPAFCEDECRRQLVDDPVSIRQIKRFAAEYDLNNGPWMPTIPNSTEKKIAIIGGGPAGLSCAYYSRLKGNEVTIYEGMPKIGGMMRYGIPRYRLPSDLLDKDIDTVIKTGISVKTNSKVGVDVDFSELQKNFDAIFISIGAWKNRKIDIPGIGLEGFRYGLDFLRKLNSGKKIQVGKKVMVVGGGHSAMDAARSARRMGAEVFVVYRRSLEQMPAKKEVHEAKEEGIKFMFLHNPVGVFGNGNGNGKVEEVELIKMKLGKPDSSGRRRPLPIEKSNYKFKVDTVLLTIGQVSDESILSKFGVDYQRGKMLCDKTTFESNLPGVFAGGDLILGTSTVIDSITTGRKAATAIDLYIKKKLSKIKEFISNPWNNVDKIYSVFKKRELKEFIPQYNHWKTVSEEDFKDEKRIQRIKNKYTDPKIRISNFEEVEKGFSEEQVKFEANRCMSCGCQDSFNCKLREFSTLYSADQYKFVGDKNKNEIDNPHQFIEYDSNKCVLCGRCVQLSEKITGETLIYYQSRGFDTKIDTPPDFDVSKIKGKFLGNFVDVCPTGAWTQKAPYNKPGPWNTKKYPTVCNGCGLGCEMNVEMYMGFPIKVTSKVNSWNKGLLCDNPRFSYKWAGKIEQPKVKNGNDNSFKEISLDASKKIVKNHMDDLVIVLTAELTIEELEEIINFANGKNIKIAGLFEEGISTAKYSDIYSSRRIKLDVNIEDYPMLKPYLTKAKNLGAIITDENHDLLIKNAPAKPKDVPTLILHKGINEVGLIKLNLQKVPKAKNYLVIGDFHKKLDGFTMVLGQSEFADLILPKPSWIEREGRIINSENSELKVNKIIEGTDFISILKKFL